MFPSFWPFQFPYLPFSKSLPKIKLFMRADWYKWVPEKKKWVSMTSLSLGEFRSLGVLGFSPSLHRHPCNVFPLTLALSIINKQKWFWWNSGITFTGYHLLLEVSGHLCGKTDQRSCILVDSYPRPSECTLVSSSQFFFFCWSKLI